MKKKGDTEVGVALLKDASSHSIAGKEDNYSLFNMIKQKDKLKSIIVKRIYVQSAFES